MPLNELRSGLEVFTWVLKVLSKDVLVLGGAA
ncbi:MAG: hypothetical protein FD177_305 [Desulfovibrionaceae bacterium]|nr:MAG: hypothetical protein FD177_305 [Desulfovibrionaceae bacterium]